jgi:hypothetical protein
MYDLEREPRLADTPRPVSITSRASLRPTRGTRRFERPQTAQVLGIPRAAAPTRPLDSTTKNLTYCRAFDRPLTTTNQALTAEAHSSPANPERNSARQTHRRPT